MCSAKQDIKEGGSAEVLGGPLTESVRVFSWHVERLGGCIGGNDKVYTTEDTHDANLRPMLKHTSLSKRGVHHGPVTVPHRPKRFRHNPITVPSLSRHGLGDQRNNKGE